MLKACCLIGVFLSSFAAKCIIVPEGVCPGRAPFFNWEGTQTESYSYVSEIFVPIKNGQELVKIEEHHGKAFYRLCGIMGKLGHVQVADPSISLTNKLNIVNAIIRSAQNMLNTIDYWSQRGFNDAVPNYEPDLNGLKSDALKIFNKLVRNGGCAEPYREYEYYERDGYDTIRRIPSGVYPNDLPRRGEPLHRSRKTWRRTLPETVFFKLITTDGEQKTNLAEGIEILRNQVMRLLPLFGNRFVPVGEKLKSLEPIFTSTTNAVNTIMYWEQEGLWMSGGAIFTNHEILCNFVATIRERLVESLSGCFYGEFPDFETFDSTPCIY